MSCFIFYIRLTCLFSVTAFAELDTDKDTDTNTAHLATPKNVPANIHGDVNKVDSSRLDWNFPPAFAGGVTASRSGHVVTPEPVELGMTDGRQSEMKATTTNLEDDELELLLGPNHALQDTGLVESVGNGAFVSFEDELWMLELTDDLASPH